MPIAARISFLLRPSAASRQMIVLKSMTESTPCGLEPWIIRVEAATPRPRQVQRPVRTLRQSARPSRSAGPPTPWPAACRPAVAARPAETGATSRIDDRLSHWLVLVSRSSSLEIPGNPRLSLAVRGGASKRSGSKCGARARRERHEPPRRPFARGMRATLDTGHRAAYGAKRRRRPSRHVVVRPRDASAAAESPARRRGRAPQPRSRGFTPADAGRSAGHEPCASSPAEAVDSGRRSLPLEDREVLVRDLQDDAGDRGRERLARADGVLPRAVLLLRLEQDRRDPCQ